MSNNFNLIAPFYDALAKLVFGSALIESQSHFLSKIKASDSVLILGGGTGKILGKFPACKKIDFIDLSSSMLKKAKRRNCQSTVEFIHTDFFSYEFKEQYDVIICPYFLDCFNANNLTKAILKFKHLLKGDGYLLVTDFDADRTHPFILKTMHYFFKVFADLESSKLQNIRNEIVRLGLEEKETEKFKNGIFTSIYKKV